MSGAQSSRWRFAILPIVVVSVILPTMLRDHMVFVEMWPKWRWMIEQFVLLLAVVTAIAAIVSGVVTWRRERRDHA